MLLSRDRSLRALNVFIFWLYSQLNRIVQCSVFVSLVRTCPCRHKLAAPRWGQLQITPIIPGRRRANPISGACSHVKYGSNYSCNMPSFWEQILDRIHVASAQWTPYSGVLHVSTRERCTAKPALSVGSIVSSTPMRKAQSIVRR